MLPGRRRHAGVLLHPTSLPGPGPIGELGPYAHAFLEWMGHAGLDTWQVLPLHPVGPGSSPYGSPSAFAGDPRLISVESLMADGLLERTALPWGSDRVDVDSVLAWKMPILRRAAQGLFGSAELAAFVAREASWLTTWARYAARQQRFGHGDWWRWPEICDAELADEIATENALQFFFDRQWSALRYAARERGIRVVGDIPIFVSHDAADIWSEPGLWLLDEAHQPDPVSGVPPDYFSPTGQRWGSPMYRWPAHAESGFQWWRRRLARELALVDAVRLDHFRGFAAAWAIPANEPDARKGHWEPGPGEALFHALQDGLGGLPFWAEDLGEITPDVEALRTGLGLPGMKVLQFAFSGPDNAFLPHEHVPHAIVYTGTHDNDPVLGWWQHLASAGEKELLAEYAGTTITEPNWTLIRLGLASCAHTFITTMPDVLGLGREARFNLPGAESGNWSWRLPEGVFEHPAGGRLARLTWVYRRAPGQKAPARQEPEPPAPGGFA
jgi:4-alpha-glucanotransferase